MFMSFVFFIFFFIDPATTEIYTLSLHDALPIFADFFEVVIDNQGRARIVYTDTSNGLASVLGNVEAADHPGAALVTVATQQTGLNAWTGKPLKATESAKPVAAIRAASGDARYPVLGG